jgi:hypothetical protein
MASTSRFRIANGVLWLYLWLSQALVPVITTGNFWSAKGRQLFSFGPFDDIESLLARAAIPFFLWLMIDWWIRRRGTA